MSQAFERVVVALRRGEAAVFPTDTVCGVGVAVGAAASPGELFRLKRRAADKPVAWLVADPADLDHFARDAPAFARAAARSFWPGGLTLIVNASEAVPPAFRSAAGTVGLRMPANPLTLALIRAVGAPLATTSANFSGAAAPATLGEADPAFLAQVAAVLDEADEDGPLGVLEPAPFPDAAASPLRGLSASGADGAPPRQGGGVASTVLDCTCDPPRILRHGAVSAAALENLRMRL